MIFTLYIQNSILWFSSQNKTKNIERKNLQKTT